MSDYPVQISDERIRAPLYRRSPVVATFVLLVTNVAFFLLMELAGGSKNQDVLLSFGASYRPYIHRGEYWRLVMPMFLHIGVLHLLVNTYALFILGPLLERVYGYGRFALIYVGCGMGSAYLSMTLSPHIAAGASGAIFGIAGAMLVTGYMHRDAVPPRWGRVFGGGILPLIVVNLILGFSIPGIDNWGHLGGLGSGVLLAALIPPPSHEPAPGTAYDKPSQAVVVIPIALVALAMTATVNHYRSSREVGRLLAESRRLDAAGETERAQGRIRDAMRLAPNDHRPYEELGMLYLRLGRTEDAIREYQAAQQLGSISPRTSFGLGVAYRRKGDREESWKVFRSVMRIDPRSPRGQHWLGDICSEEKLYGDAVEFYRESLRLAPNNAVTHNNLAWLLATSSDPQFRDPAGALAHAQRAVELSGGKVAAFTDTLAEAHYVNGNFQEAVKVQTRTLELEPDNEEFQERMARYRKAAGV